MASLQHQLDLAIDSNSSFLASLNHTPPSHLANTSRPASVKSYEEMNNAYGNATGLNDTESDDVQYHIWVPETLIRGTFSILSTCLLTMIFSIWTAVHLNVPEYGKAHTQLWRRSKWLLISLFAPEIVVLIAYWQYSEAMKFTRLMCERLGRKRTSGIVRRVLMRCKSSLRPIKKHSGDIAMEPEVGTSIPTRRSQQGANERPRHEWTTTHSMYALMGGLVIDTSDLELPSYLPENQTRMALGLGGLQFLAKYQPELLVTLSESAIMDKSKANTFVKTITCVQALWFCIHCITRYINGLSISLLEINTAAHSICALTLYLCFWWDKPLDVDEGTPILNDGIHPLGALLSVIQMYPYAEFPIQTEPVARDPILDEERTEDEVSQAPGSGQGPERLPTYPYGFANIAGAIEDDDHARLKLASEAMHKYNIVTSKQYILFILDDSMWTKNARGLLVKRIDNMPPIRSLLIRSEKVWKSLFFIGLPIGSAFYGGIHLLAWKRTFRTTTEEMLWKISGITIAAFGMLSVLVPDMLNSVLDIVKYRRQASAIHDFFSFVLYIVRLLVTLVEVLVSVLYILCRVYIIVECFLDVFHLPDSAFQVPQWTQYVPHIS